ncbi:MAG: FHA domain-containing protein, partial [Nitrospira sp.]|nr:FHA domain-containing protein [Nitrospira sp.]
RSATRTFQLDRITIGRGSRNTYVPEGPKESVSRNHAEICETQGVWSISDNGSLNGTKLNGKQLIAKQEYPLHDGDQLVLGKVKLEFRSGIQGETIDLSKLATPAEAMSVDESAVGDAPQTSATTSRTTDESKTEAKSQPESASIRKEPRQQDDSEDHLIDQSHAEPGQANTSVPTSSNDRPQETRYTHKLLDAVSFGLAKAIGGRREFQELYGTKMTRFFTGEPNPIKEAEDAKQIAAILLNPTSYQLTEEEVIACVKEVFEDIVVHQLGLIKALDGSARGVLKQFDPATIHAGTLDKVDGKGIAWFNNRKDQENAEAWQRYVSKYRKVTNEGVDIREGIVGRQIAESYRSVYKSRNRS